MFEGVCQQKKGGDSIGCGTQPEGADKSGFAGFVPECEAAAITARPTAKQVEQVQFCFGYAPAVVACALFVLVVKQENVCAQCEIGDCQFGQYYSRYT